MEAFITAWDVLATLEIVGPYGGPQCDMVYAHWNANGRPDDPFGMAAWILRVIGRRPAEEA